jgi:predicted phage terminase large subunit-like protein
MSPDIWKASVTSMARYLTKGVYTSAPQAEVTADVIDRAVFEGGVRAIISMPPRHSKTYTATEMGTPWGLMHHPWLNYTVTSYNANLSEKWGRSVRNFCKEHSPKLGFDVASDASARGEWYTTKNGRAHFVGIGGGITGTGFHIGLIDDYLKDAKEAKSATVRDSIWDWYGTTFYTRQTPRPDGKEPSIIIIATRWHVDDLIGRLVLRQELGLGLDSKPFEIIKLPAIAESGDYLGRNPGEALWPARFPLSKLREIQADLEVWMWEALYQQNPIANEDAAFPPYEGWHTFSRADILDMAWKDSVISVDSPFARTEKSDYLAATNWQLAHDGTMYGTDFINQRGSFTEQESAVMQLANRNLQTRNILIELGATGPALMKTLKEKLPGKRLIGFKPKGSKESRAAICEQPVREGRIKIIDRSECPLSEGFATQCFHFPNGAHDDMVDTMSSAAIHWMASKYIKPKKGLQMAGIAERVANAQALGTSYLNMGETKRRPFSYRSR